MQPIKLPFNPLLVLLLFISGCAVVAEQQLNARYGTPEVQERTVAASSDWGQRWRREIKPIIDNRCVVCHACYDAPCQLKLSAPEGIDRGATTERVYDGTRVLSATPTRLFVDASDTTEWRTRGFNPVLNEREPSPEANREGSLIYQLLKLKTVHPSMDEPLLSDRFDLALDRDQVCTRIEEFEQYQSEHPEWGMPYGLPPIADGDFSALTEWLEAGAPMPKATALPRAHQLAVARWERFFNQPGNKARLAQRYLYEHLFLAHLYFDQLPLEHPETQTRLFFTLVRSSTPPGTPIAVIPSRRPYDDPGTERFYYRLQPVRETISVKTHMPYALNPARQARWQALFLDPDYAVTQLPGYDVATAANPFEAFKAIPVSSRYRFLLDEAQFTIMGFIKGPVCRGQIALSVINDHFWVFFHEPALYEIEGVETFLADQVQQLQLPAENEDILRPIKYWLDYSSREKAYLHAKYRLLNSLTQEGNGVGLNVVWNGEGHNDNAALTVTRHFDSATVNKGLLGQDPKTAWLIGYPELERIHYLLVAGFDVYGNLGHQLLTRLYMDFLRMESEFNFLTLLPREERIPEWRSWYRGADGNVLDYMEISSRYFYPTSAITYAPPGVHEAPGYKEQLFALLQKRLAPVLNTDLQYAKASVPPAHQALLRALEALPNAAVQHTAQLTLLSIQDKQKTYLYSLLHHNAHSNISSLLNEASNRRPEEDRLGVVAGLGGSYPGAFWRIDEPQIPDFLARLQQVEDEADYFDFVSRFGVRRTDPDFWSHADAIHRQLRAEDPVQAGLLDFNRLENR